MRNDHSIKNILNILLYCLIIISLAGCEQFWQIFDKQIIIDYNERFDKVNKIVAEHDELVTDINLNISNITKERDMLHEYLTKESLWMGALKDFQQFIEVNEKRIRRVGINPNYVRDNTLNVIKMMQQNELNFRKALQFKTH